VVTRTNTTEQTSGTSNFGDHPISGEPNLTIRSDEDEIYSWEKETAEDWILRKVDVAITDAGEHLGVKTAIINPPLICKSLCFLAFPLSCTASPT
jgi:hypothetical protein